MKMRTGSVLIGLWALIILACETESPYAKVEVWLTDAPGDYKEVRIEVLEVEAHRESGDQGSGWLKLNTRGGVYDLLKLTNGRDTLLGHMELPAGKVSQIRLKLSNRNSVVIGDETFALRLPSAYQSGIKIQLHQPVEEGVRYKILLDFDVARSIVDNGNGSFTMIPVIRAITRADGGSIGGKVLPAESSPAVYAILGADTVASAYTDHSGGFLLQGLQDGTYTVGFAPASTYQNTAVEGVVVQSGTQTNLGQVTVNQ